MKWLLPLFIIIAILILIAILIKLLKKPRVKSIQPRPEIVEHSTPITSPRLLTVSESNNTTMTIPVKLRDDTISSTKMVTRNNANDMTNTGDEKQ